MKKLNYLFIVGLLLMGVGCTQELTSTFDEDEGLITDFPDSKFEFAFDYDALRNGASIMIEDSVVYPIPQNAKSFAHFSSTSNVFNDNGIRLVKCDLLQDKYLLLGNAPVPDNEYTHTYGLNIRLNVSTTGDALDGNPFEKWVLLDFLEEGKTYPTGKNQLGAIELDYFQTNYVKEGNWGFTLFVGNDGWGNIGESDYTVKVIRVEDYEDVTREGEVIKSALRVEIEFEGLIGVSNYSGTPEELLADQWEIKNGRAAFLVDYAQ